MKKKILTIAATLLIGGLSVFFFGACDKDTNCYVEITVVDEATKLPLNGVFVKIDSNVSDYGDTTTSSVVNATGFTDPMGIFRATFSAPAILNVYAVWETGYDSIYTPDLFYCYRDGKNNIKLKEGDTVRSTVVLLSKINHPNRN